MLFDKPAPFCFPIGNAIAGAKENPFVVTCSLTKVYGLSGLRCGWILARPAVARRMQSLNNSYGSTPVHPSALMGVPAREQLGATRARARAIVEADRRALSACLARHR